jgi:hypothetical protein
MESSSALYAQSAVACQLIVLTHEEAERVADDDCLAWVKEVEPPRRTFDLEKIVRWAFADGYRSD